MGSDDAGLRSPHLSRHPTNPIGQTDRIRSAVSAIRKRLRVARDIALDALAAMPVIVSNRRYYEYQVSPDAMKLIVMAVESALRDDGRTELADAVRQAYREGTAKAALNLVGLTDDYTREITRLLASEPVERRAALAAARVFELMDRFSGDTTTDLGYLLFRAVQDGQNPREVARDIRKRFAMQARRAERIARTEITMSLRRGRWDETRDAADRLGLNVFLLHQSALIPGRTRTAHAARHGRIVSVEDQAEWYMRDGNAINCLCSSSEILLDGEGNPVTGVKLIGRMKRQRDKFLALDKTPRS